MKASIAAASRRWAGRVTLSRCRTWGTVSAGVFSPQPTAEPAEEALRQQGHGGVVVPAAPAPDLVVVQSQLLLGLLAGLLHRPAQAQEPGQRLGRGVGGGIAQVRFQLAAGVQRAPQHQPDVRAG